MATLKQALAGKLPKEDIEKAISSYDIIGSIAIIEIPEGLEKKEKIIAKTLLEMHPNIKTVLKKAGAHKGKYRRQKLKVLAGKRTKVAEYKESNATIRLDVEKVYFSPRLSTERKRVYQLVNPGERVLVMFSGCAPYPLVIAKNTSAKKVYGIELNPIAHKFAIDNAKLNKLENLELIQGDAKKEVPRLKKQGKKFDRIVMPLPKDAGSFLKEAFMVSKKGTVVHFYDFSHVDEFSEKKGRVMDACKENGRKCKILRIVKCGSYSPRVFRICIDFKIMG